MRCWAISLIPTLTASQITKFQILQAAEILAKAIYLGFHKAIVVLSDFEKVRALRDALPSFALSGVPNVLVTLMPAQSDNTHGCGLRMCAT